MSIIAIDVAILPPAPVTELALALSAGLPREHSKGLRLDANHLPHITLTQQFVESDDLEAVFDRIAAALKGMSPLTLHAPGTVRSREAVWLKIARAEALARLHRRLMDTLAPFERPNGDPSAFAGGDARPNDVAWVSRYRESASFDAYTPHITLGHAVSAPAVEPTTFVATEIAACQLGRFCTCRTVLRRWTLADAATGVSPSPVVE